MSSFVTPVSYTYGVNVKMKYAPKGMELAELFPGVEDLVIRSRKFETLEQAVSSAKGLIVDITDRLNDVAAEEYFKTYTEVNPKFSGHQTVSKEWAPNEVAKLWIIPTEANAEKEPVVAIGLAQIMEAYEEQVLKC